MERRRSTGPRRTPANLVPSASLCCAVTHMNFAVIATDLMCRHGSFSGLSEWHRRCGLIGPWLCENSEQMVASANPRPPPFACDLPCFGNPWHTAFNKRLGCRHYVVARAAVVLRREPVDAVQPRIAGRLQMVDVQSQPSGEDLNRSGRKVLQVLQVHAETHPVLRRGCLVSRSSAVRGPNHQPPAVLEQTDGAAKQSEGFDRVLHQVVHDDRVRRIEIPTSLRQLATNNRDAECALQKIAGDRKSV